MNLVLLILLMTAVAPSKIDSPQEESRYFLPAQLRWIHDDSQMRLWEKSFRIGATFADAFKNVRKRLRFKKRDYLFASKDYPSALEYMELCRQFCDIYNLTRNIISTGEMLEEIPKHDAEGKRTGFTEVIKIAYIKFDNGSHIRAFSSNPNAMLVYGGDVGLDEFPRHERAQELYDVAQARITWGFDMAMWGSHFGIDTLFYEKAKLARKGLGGWSHHFTTIEDAVREGLVEKINQVRGTTFTREGFIADCRKRAGSEATYQQAYMCNPQGSASRIVTWSQIETCLADYQIERTHLESSQIVELFGAHHPSESQKLAREKRIGNFLRDAFPKLFAARCAHRLGYDVAASGEGDLACVYVDEAKVADAWLRGLLTFRTDDWAFHGAAMRYFMRRLTSVRAAGDETGLGRQTCWELEKEFPGQFIPVNFSGEKQDMFASLMNRLASAAKRFPRDEPDIAQDYFCFSKTQLRGKFIFTAGKNELNKASHGDIATGGALADRAGRDALYTGSDEDIQAWGKPRGERSQGGLEG